MSRLRDLLTPPEGESRWDVVLVLLFAFLGCLTLSLTGLPGGCW